MWPGTFGVLIGAFFFLFSFEIFHWDQMSELWPAFPLIVGLSFVATWFAGSCRKLQLLVPAAINLSVGVVGLGFTFGLIDRHTLNLLWPLGLVVLGALPDRAQPAPRADASPIRSASKALVETNEVEALAGLAVGAPHHVGEDLAAVRALREVVDDGGAQLTLGATRATTGR